MLIIHISPVGGSLALSYWLRAVIKPKKERVSFLHFFVHLCPLHWSPSCTSVNCTPSLRGAGHRASIGIGALTPKSRRRRINALMHRNNVKMCRPQRLCRAAGILDAGERALTIVFQLKLDEKMQKAFGGVNVALGYYSQVS